MPRANGKWMILLCRCSVKTDFQGKGESGFGMSSAGGGSGCGDSSTALAPDGSLSGSGEDVVSSAAGEEEAAAAGDGDGFLCPSWAATAGHSSRARPRTPQVRAECRFFMLPLLRTPEGYVFGEARATG